MERHDSVLASLAREHSLIFDYAQVGILVLRERQILNCNSAMATLFGYASPSELIGKTTRVLYASEEAYVTTGQMGYAMLERDGAARFEAEMCHRDGTTLWMIQSGCPLQADDVLHGPSIWVYTDITERRRTEAIRQGLIEKFTKAFDACPLAASISSIADGRFLDVNASYERNFGWSWGDLVGRTSLEVGFWANSDAREHWLKAIQAAGRLVDYETVWLCKDGRRRDVSLSSEIVEMDNVPCILTYLTDITERKQSEADLRIAAAAFQSQEGMLVTDAHGIILRVNKAFVETTGYSEADVIGRTPGLLRSERHDDAFYRSMWQALIEKGFWQGEVWDRRKNGEVFPKWLTISAVRDAAGKVTNYIGTHFDITERKRAEAQIEALAFFDQLTNLPNRTLLMDRLRQTQVAARRNGQYCALIFLDLDNFKRLNDTHGHDYGDRLLRQVAERLRTAVRQGDTVARLGGDEFVLILPELGLQPDEAASVVEVVCDKLLKLLNTPYQIVKVRHHSSASMGVTLFNTDKMPIEDLMKQADLALYRAKEGGRNRMRFFDPTLERAVHRRAALENDLRQALEEKQLLLHLQPQVGEHGEVIGTEALLRWSHPERGLISPGEFIPLAEETGLILPMGRWVLAQACALLVRWAGQPALSHLRLAVNVSAQQFRQEDFVEMLAGLLRESGARPDRLKLELTESLLVEDLDIVAARMTALQEMGIRFALDDFGTGYSSLSYLKRLPLEQLKIDQSFVRDVLSDASDASIARTIIALAQNLGLDVIAEGVELAGQLDFLRAAGCLHYQGYYFSRPLPVAEFERFVRAGQAALTAPSPV